MIQKIISLKPSFEYEFNGIIFLIYNNNYFDQIYRQIFSWFAYHSNNPE
jgi:hypothetical protein